MICVFDIGNSNYTGNGDAVLVPVECKLHNVAGGNYDLTMSHPMDPGGKWKYLVPGAIIRCPVPEEKIENAYAGYDVDVYKTNVKAELREGPSEPTVINYQAWQALSSYAKGSKVTYSGKNYRCDYWDPTSPVCYDAPPYLSWWTEIPRYTQGSPSLVTLPAGAELYDVESYDTTWEKMSTFYGIVGYIKKSQVTYDRHLTPSETKPRIITEQLFRIEKPTVDTKNRTVSVTAKHVSYDLSGVLIQDAIISQASPAMALSRIADAFMIPYAGTIATNLDAEENGTYTQEIKGKNGMFALLDPDKGVVSTFKAEFRRDNWDLFVMTQENTDRGFRLQYRKNLLGVNWAQDASGIITRVVPIAKDAGGNDLYLPEKWIDSDDIGDYPVIKMEQLQVKGQVGKDKGTGDGATWTESDLLDEMRTKAAERFTVDHADQVSVAITIDFEQLGDTEEYKALKGLEKVLLYDTVTAEDAEIGLNVKLYVSELEWDAIRKKVTAIKLVNAMGYSKGTVTGYNVQAKSIGSDKLSDDVKDSIISQVRDIIPEYSDPDAKRKTTVTDGDPTLAWNTRSKVATVSGTDIHVTMPANPSSASDNDPTLAWGTRSKVGTVGGTDLHVTMPANPNTEATVAYNSAASDFTEFAKEIINQATETGKTTFVHGSWTNNDSYIAMLVKIDTDKITGSMVYGLSGTPTLYTMARNGSNWNIQEIPSWLGVNNALAAYPICTKLTRNNITQPVGISYWTISGFAQKTGYIRRIVAVNPSVSDIIYLRTEDDTDDKIRLYLKNISSASATFNLEAIGMYIPSSS